MEYSRRKEHEFGRYVKLGFVLRAVRAWEAELCVAA
jgi:hypothetical protein